MRNNSFKTPTRQSKIGIVANFLFFMQKFVRAFIPVIVLFIVKDSSNIPLSWVVIGTSILFLLVAIWSYVAYRNFFFYIDEKTDSFIIMKGVLAKSKTIVPLENIQQVTLNQKFIHKLVQVYAVEIDSAGSTEKEVEIPSVSHDIALELKSLLLSYNKTEVSNHVHIDVNTTEQNDSVQKLSIWTLIKLGLTTNYLQTLGLILAFFITFFEQYSNIFLKDYSDEEVFDMYRTSDVESLVILYVLVVLISLVLMVNVVRVIMKFFNYSISVQNNTFLVNYGLLSTHNVILRPRRIQLLKITQNFFQRKMDLFHLKINQVISGESKGKNVGLEIPGYSKAEKDTFFNLVFEHETEKPLFELAPNYRFWAFRFFIFAIIPATVGLLIYMNHYDWKIVSALCLAYILLMGLIQYRIFKVRKLIVYKDLICLHSGFWDVTETWLEPNKIQKLSVSQLFWQKKYDIGTLTLLTAGGNVSFQTTSYSELTQLSDLWLYEIESANKGWM